MSEIGDAFRRTEALANARIDRRGWTEAQWADDAERIMAHIDGASSALLNGHINGLIARIRELTPRTITTAEELDALPFESVIRDGDECILERWGQPEENLWVTVMVNAYIPRGDIALPATVLFEPLAA